MTQPFKFKQFTIHQDRCAMKIGTDGVLLGGWISLENNPESILDIGTGTGIIALMLAQRSTATLIDALEIDDDAYEQATENFENSDWGDRLFCYHASFNEFAEEMSAEGMKYDLIVSNPPFHEPNLSPSTSRQNNEEPSHQRKMARFYDALPFSGLLEGISKLLASEGKFNVILPKTEETAFLKSAENFGLFPHKITWVKGNKDAIIKRSLIEFGFRKIKFEPEILIIEISRHHYTDEYKNLVADFYLKM
ncbi:MAG TPA: methyltransferase [Salinimicrobium sp.]|nr:methyltransferase [Salinimicrobium sp.]